MLNPERPETKEFIEQFVSSPIQCSKVCERIDLCRTDAAGDIRRTGRGGRYSWMLN